LGFQVQGQALGFRVHRPDAGSGFRVQGWRFRAQGSMGLNTYGINSNIVTSPRDHLQFALTSSASTQYNSHHTCLAHLLCSQQGSGLQVQVCQVQGSGFNSLAPQVLELGACLHNRNGSVRLPQLPHPPSPFPIQLRIPSLLPPHVLHPWFSVTCPNLET